MMDWRGALDRIYRRVLLVIARARVLASADDGVVRELQLRLSADEIHDAVTQIQEYGFASRPLPGCDVVAVFVAGDRTQGIAIGTNDQRHRPTNLAPGDVMVYDHRGNSMLMNAAGITCTTPETFRVHAQHIEMHATGSYRFDVNGHGEFWFPVHVDTYRIGESPGTAYNISPPEIG